MVDAVQAAGGRARGIATVRPDISDAELNRLHRAGVRGVRFNFLKRLVRSAPPQEDLAIIARKIAPPLGWHVVIYFEGEDLEGLEGFFGSLPTPLVVDHMGRPNVTKPVDGPEFSRFLRFVDQNNVWVKVSCPERLSVSGPPALGGEQHAYADAVPFGGKSLKNFRTAPSGGARTGHTPNLTGHMPDDGLLIDYIPPSCGHTGTATQAARGQSHAALLARRRRLIPATPTHSQRTPMMHSNAANRLDRLPISRLHKITLIAVAFAYFFEFADINSFATTVPKLITLWGGVTINQIAYVTSLSFVGMFFGSLIASWLADRWGAERRPWSSPPCGSRSFPSPQSSPGTSFPSAPSGS